MKLRVQSKQLRHTKDRRQNSTGILVSIGAGIDPSFTASRAPTAGWSIGSLTGILWIPGKAVACGLPLNKAVACGLPLNEDEIGANTDLISAAIVSPEGTALCQPRVERRESCERRATLG